MRPERSRFDLATGGWSRRTGRRRAAGDGGRPDPDLPEDLSRWIDSLGTDRAVDVDGEDLPARVDRFLDDHPMQRDRITGQAPALVAALDGLTGEARERAFAVLSALHREGSVPDVRFSAVADGLEDDPPTVRAATLSMLVDHLWLDPNLARRRLPDLTAALDDPDPAVRGQAVRGLMRVDSYADDPVLEADLSAAVDPHREAVVAALEGLPPEPVAAAASRLADHLAEDPETARSVVPTLVEALEGSVVARLNGFVALALLARGDETLVDDQLEAIARPAALATVADQFGAQDDRVRVACAALFARLAAVAPDAFEGVVTDLARAADDDRHEVRLHVVETVDRIAEARPDVVDFEARFHLWLGAPESGEFGDPEAFADDLDDHVETIRGYTSQLARLLTDADADDRATVARTFAEVTGENPLEAVAYVDDLAPYLDDDSAVVRRGIAATLAHVAAARPAVVAPHAGALAGRLSDPDPAVRRRAVRALDRVAAEPAPVTDPTVVAAVVEALSDRTRDHDRRDRAALAGLLATAADERPGVLAEAGVVDDLAAIRTGASSDAVREYLAAAIEAADSSGGA